MVSTRLKRQSNRRFLSQLDEFNRDIVFGNAASHRQETVVVFEGTFDQEINANDTSNNLTANEDLVTVKTSERCFNERTDREMGNIVDTVEDRIQNAILTAIDSIITHKV